MKIVYLIDQFHKHGGIEKMLSLKINHFIENYEYNVTLITTQHVEGQPFVYRLSEKLTHINLGVNYLKGKSYFHPLNLLKALKHFFKLKKQIRVLEPDVVISAGFSPEQYFLPLIVKKAPIIKEFHFSGVILKRKRNKILNTLNNFLFKQFNKYDAVVVLNEDEKKYYNFKNLVVIPNFIKLKEGLTTFRRDNTIIGAGRISGVKQFNHLIEAWSLIADKFPDWQVKIFGDGDVQLSKELTEQIRKDNIPRIKLMGATTQLTAEMQKASIFAMTSANECFPMVLLEAQSVGLPIISYDCPNGPRNIIQNNRNGILIKDQCINEFADKLTLLIENPEVRRDFGHRAKNSVYKYSANAVMGEWNNLIKSVI
ncbi:glycosyltransferase family 4 protein [Aequorivita xiaoshiensis]|uniref:Glycosyltransferase family 4 protein n=1 Tax=Aequorivita xiaoshiensis TaxID=2874476 RepID=A0A9X1R215_9FLAO|nr:glycosyltransferase family 4 protein [Aequorivita xiaoshiensis]MCG2431690.1 glycosyltransferase family 4 protein [Aequorivita xiaoshiensis]